MSRSTIYSYNFFFLRVQHELASPSIFDDRLVFLFEIFHFADDPALHFEIRVVAFHFNIVFVPHANSAASNYVPSKCCFMFSLKSGRKSFLCFFFCVTSGLFSLRMSVFAFRFSIVCCAPIMDDISKISASDDGNCKVRFLFLKLY